MSGVESVSWDFARLLGAGLVESPHDPLGLVNHWIQPGSSRLLASSASQRQPLMHNITVFAQVAVLLFIPIGILIFQKYEHTKAAAIVLVAGPLMLPELVEFDLPGLPPMDKHQISALIVFFAVIFGRKDETGRASSVLIPFVILLIVVGAAGTYWTNRDDLTVSPVSTKGGLSIADGIQMTTNGLLFVLLPFWLGTKLFNTRERVIQLAKVMLAFGLLYGLFMLVEIRMSPRMNIWIYGFHQHSWRQALRNDGYRPIVFMAHGLATTMYCVTSIFWGVTLTKMGERLGTHQTRWLTIFLFGVLCLSNSFGSLIYAVCLTPILWKAPPRLLSLLASVLALFVLFIPLLRVTHALPLEELVLKLAEHKPDRALSLGFRFDMEEMVLDKWIERPWFGYGGYGRGRVFDEEGHNITVLDSAWIIAVSKAGILGFSWLFLMLLAPIGKARKHIARVPDRAERVLFSGLAIIVVVSAFDLLMNGLFTYFPLLLAGALYGYSVTLEQRGYAPAGTPG